MRGQDVTTLRAIGTADAALLSALHAQSMADAWSIESFAGLLEMENSFGLCAASGDIPTGFVLARTVQDEAEVIALAVTAPSRRRGVGRTLLEAAMRAAKARGAQRLFLEVSEANAPAIALYRAAGFVAVGRRKAYYARPAGAEDALIMAAPLDGIGRGRQ